MTISDGPENRKFPEKAGRGDARKLYETEDFPTDRKRDRQRTPQRRKNRSGTDRRPPDSAGPEAGQMTSQRRRAKKGKTPRDCLIPGTSSQWRYIKRCVQKSGLRTRRFCRGMPMTVTAVCAVAGAAALFPVPENRADGQRSYSQKYKNDNQITQNWRHKNLLKLRNGISPLRGRRRRRNHRYGQGFSGTAGR